LLIPLYGGNAFAARIIVRPPHVAVRLPAPQAQQQLSFWGVKTNLQQSYDEAAAAPPIHHRHSRLQAVKAVPRMQ
jgi:hypothetical protein